VRIHSEPRTSKDQRARAAYMPADRHREGLMMTLSVRENAALVPLRRYTKGLFMSTKTEGNDIGRDLTELDVKAPNMDANVASLSGGNQQKVIVAKLLGTKPKVIIIDEPTKGVDVGAKAAIHEIMGELASQGFGIIMVSSEMPEVLGMSDRIAVMREGRISAVFDREEATQEKILEAAMAANSQAQEHLRG